MAEVLDPIGLLHQLKQLQQAVFRCAAGCSPFASSPLADPLHVFSVEQCTAGKLPAEKSVPPPNAGLEAFYREQERRKRVLGWRRTHKDPDEGRMGADLLLAPGQSRTRAAVIFFGSCSAALQDAISHYKFVRRCRGMRKIRTHLMEIWEEQWQEEVIRGPLSSPVSARCPASISWQLSNEQPPG